MPAAVVDAAEQVEERLRAAGRGTATVGLRVNAALAREALVRLSARRGAGDTAAAEAEAEAAELEVVAALADGAAATETLAARLEQIAAQRLGLGHQAAAVLLAGAAARLRGAPAARLPAAPESSAARTAAFVPAAAPTPGSAAAPVLRRSLEAAPARVDAVASARVRVVADAATPRAAPGGVSSRRDPRVLAGMGALLVLAVLVGTWAMRGGGGRRSAVASHDDLERRAASVNDHVAAVVHDVPSAAEVPRPVLDDVPGETGGTGTREARDAPCATCTTSAASPEALLARQHDALNALDATALAKTWADDVVRIGPAADDVRVGRDAALVQPRRELEELGGRGAGTAVRSVYSHALLALDGKAAFLVDEQEWSAVAEGQTHTWRTVMTELALERDGKWLAVFVHAAEPLPNGDAKARARGGHEPELPALSGGNGAAVDALVAEVSDAFARAESGRLFSRREGVVGIGSAPGERLMGAKVGKGWTGLAPRLSLEGRPAAGIAPGGRVAWFASALALRVGHGDAAFAVHYRLTLLLERQDGAWRVVLVHASSPR